VQRARRLVSVAAWAAAAIALLLLLGALIEQRPFAFDRALIIGLRQPSNPAIPLGGPRLLQIMQDITALGAGTILTLAVAAVAGLLLAQRKWLAAGLVVASTLSGSLLVSWAKLHTARARPDLVPHLADVSSLSFPSAHAANSAIVYLALAAVASQAVAHRRVRTYLLASAIALVAVIGASRVYLGVHWPSDVLAGWAFGALWAWSWWWAGKRAREEAAAGT
jgi:undecaprenyl-diphosphatase